MARYFLDTEFNGFKGEIISLSLVRMDTKALYLVFPRPIHINAWVDQHVIPYIRRVPKHVEIHQVFEHDAGKLLEEFFKGDKSPEIVVDWPDDIKYLSELLLTGPGTMINVPALSFHLERIDAYPTRLAGAVQHNAYWDAMALREKYYETYHPDEVII